MRVAVRGETPDLDAPARQGKHGVAARRVSVRADARAARILRDAIAPLRIAEDGVEDTRDLSGPLVEIRSGPSFEEAVVLPVVARVAQRGDEIARARERLLEALVIQLCAALPWLTTMRPLNVAAGSPCGATCARYGPIAMERSAACVG